MSNALIKLSSPSLNQDGFSIYSLNDETCRLMLKEAEAALKYTYPKPNSGYSVSLITKSGKLIAGASYVSDTHNTTMHSEAVALARAAQEGETGIVAITGPDCHNCKQLIWESSIRSRIDTVVVIIEEEGIKQIPISAMMPYPWPDINLKH